MTVDDSMPGSITQMIERLREEDPQAAGQIWQRYFERLIPLARTKLRALPHRAVDEEDVLVSVFDRFFQAVREDRFAKLEDRDDLWQILILLTERKVVDQFREAATQKRGGGRVVQTGDDSVVDLRDFSDREPGPEFVATFNDHLARALRRIGDEATREVALLRLEGYRSPEIAARLDISLSSVERKLRVIRAVWEEEFGTCCCASLFASLMNAVSRFRNPRKSFRFPRSARTLVSTDLNRCR